MFSVMKLWNISCILVKLVTGVCFVQRFRKLLFKVITILEKSKFGSSQTLIVCKKNILQNQLCDRASVKTMQRSFYRKQKNGNALFERIKFKKTFFCFQNFRLWSNGKKLYLFRKVRFVGVLQELTSCFTKMRSEVFNFHNPCTLYYKCLIIFGTLMDWLFRGIWTWLTEYYFQSSGCFPRWNCFTCVIFSDSLSLFRVISFSHAWVTQKNCLLIRWISSNYLFFWNSLNPYTDSTWLKFSDKTLVNKTVSKKW